MRVNSKPNEAITTPKNVPHNQGATSSTWNANAPIMDAATLGMPPQPINANDAFTTTTTQPTNANGTTSMMTPMLGNAYVTPMTANQAITNTTTGLNNAMLTPLPTMIGTAEEPDAGKQAVAIEPRYNHPYLKLQARYIYSTRID